MRSMWSAINRSFISKFSFFLSPGFGAIIFRKYWMNSSFCSFFISEKHNWFVLTSNIRLSIFEYNTKTQKHEVCMQNQTVWGNIWWLFLIFSEFGIWNWCVWQYHYWPLSGDPLSLFKKPVSNLWGLLGFARSAFSIWVLATFVSA